MMTLSDQWQRHADASLPSDASQAQVIRARRDWYYERLLELKAAPQTPENVALLAECLGFARTIGRPEEAATQ